MSTLLPKSVVCPVLIGRSEQLALLSELIASGATGERSVILISGDAGIGKTRLIAEVMHLASERGVNVLQGHCFEQDRSFPYAPLIDLLGSFATERSPDILQRDLGDVASELVKLLPELANRLDNVSPSPLLNPEQEKQRLFHSLTRLFARLTAVEPLVVVIEDMHWSDDTSLEYLLYLVRRLIAQPLLLLLSYRTYEVTAPLRHFLAELDREHVAREIALEHLSRDQVGAMVRAIFNLPHPTTNEFLDSIYGLSEGNPFFVEEVLKSLVSSGAIYVEDGEWTRRPMGELQVPRSVQDAVARRTASLTDFTGRLMTLAAVAGRRFDFGLLQGLTGADERVLLQSIKEMVAEQLVVEESAERFAFRHALTREAIYSTLLERERIALHGMIAETIKEVYADSVHSRSRELSYHYFEAGNWEAALVYAKAAGDQAHIQYALSEARQHYDRARACAELLNLPERLAELDEALGDVGFAAGEYVPAADAFVRALDIATAAPQRARIKAKLGAAYAMNVDERGEALLQSALEDLDPETQANELARAMVWLARVYWHRMQFAPSIALCERALGLTDRIDDPTTLVWIYRQLASTYSVQLQLDKSIAWARKCVDAGERGAHPLQVHGYAMLSQSMLCKGEWDDALNNAIAMHDMSEQVGWLLEIAWANSFRCWALYGQGNLVEALNAARTTLSQAQEIRESRLTVEALAFLTLFSAELGDEAAARRYGESAVRHAEELEEVSLQSDSRRSLAHVHVLCEEWEDALALFDQCTESLAEAESGYELMIMGPDRASSYLALGRMDEAEHVLAECLAIADEAQAPHYRAVARRVQGQLFAVRDQPVEARCAFDEAIATLTDTGSNLELAHALYRRGLFRENSGAVDDARADLEKARRLYEQTGARPMLWRTHAALGRLAGVQGHTAEADRKFASARAVVEELAAEMDDEGLRDGLLRRAGRVLPRQRTLTARQAMQRKYGGLTARERQVAAWVAMGDTNHTIADALVLSERTVEGHVSSILGKLDFSSRAQIAAWAVSVGLIERQEVESSKPAARE